MQSIVATSLLPTHMPKAILASLEELKRIQAVQVPDELHKTRADDFLPTTFVVRREKYDTLRDLLKRITAERDALERDDNQKADANRGLWIRAEAAESKFAETKRLLVEARDDVAELLERMKTEGWHRDDRIECHVALLTRIDAAIKEQKCS
jgi:hypothetical protein